MIKKGMMHKINIMILLLFFTACNKTEIDNTPQGQKLDSLQGVIKNQNQRIRYLESKVAVLSGNKEDTFKQTNTNPVQFDLQEIKERGKLIAITTYGATSYFIYRGRPMGFEYELLKKLAQYLGVELEIKIAYNLDEFFRMLNSGEGDIVAHNLTVTKSRQEVVSFTEPHSITRQVLVQRKPDSWRKLGPNRLNEKIVRSTIDLIGKDVHVRKGSSYYDRLISLSEEIGGNINIKAISGKTETTEIIEQVANGKINYTIADKHIAELNSTYYNNLDVKTPVSFSQRLSWAVRKNSPQLKTAINEWLSSIKNTAFYNNVYNKYFKSSKSYNERMKSPYYSKKGGKISPYDDLFKKYGERIAWDWRLLASQAFQESSFNPNAKSWAGARGLMQIMPRTAAELGNYNLVNPEESIAAGTKYLNYLRNIYQEIPDPEERKKFILAAYNAGMGHVADARRLTKKYGDDPDLWSNNVEKWMLKKELKRFYQDKVVKYGYCRGEEPVHYVEIIMYRFNKYKKFIELST